MTSLHRGAVRGGGVAIVTAALTVLGAAPALAHVTAQPGTAQKGGYSVVTFRVPNESDTAGTVGLTVTLPADHPVSSVRTTPLPGWTATTTTVPLNPPVKDDDGRTITATIGAVTWKADPGTRIAPGQYLDFPLSLGPFPDDVDRLVLPATQTYDDGRVVDWNEPTAPGAAEPEHPAPAVTLTAAAPEGGSGMSHGGAAEAAPPAAPAAPQVDGTARWLGGLGLRVGALGLGVGTGALARSRRAGPAAASREDAARSR